MRKELYIIGCGPGGIANLTKEALEAINNCEKVFAFDRLCELFRIVREDIESCIYNEIFNKVTNTSAIKIGILVSGDVGFFSMSRTLIDKFGIDYKIYTLCGISSMQYLCSMLGISYENISCVSLHGREKSVLGNIAYNRYTFVLTGGENNASKILKDLHTSGVGNITVTAGEMLSMKDERIIKGSIEELMQYKFDSLTVLLFENEVFKNKEDALFDKDFIRNKTPMTKQEVRWISINTLKINPIDVVYDIGAGSGSVSIEMARKAYNGIVYAIEKNEIAFELLNKNKNFLGALNLITIFDEALIAIKKLPIPNKVFIGGSGGNLSEIIHYLYEINPSVKIVINAITIETLTLAMQVFNEFEINPSVVCLNCARNNVIGNNNLMFANNPVYIISNNVGE